ncbi:MAG: 30S ribosomal protein S19e [Candidatus Woesearchaeota archaeon]
MKEIMGVKKTELIEEIAKNLREIRDIKAPVWAEYSKSGTHKSRPPARTDFWYIRSASVLFKVSRKGPIGVSKLRTFYGGKKRRGHQPPEFRKGSGSRIRKILQQLEKAGLIKYVEKGVHKGRIVTPAGSKIIAKSAKAILSRGAKNG